MHRKSVSIGESVAKKVSSMIKPHFFHIYILPFAPFFVNLSAINSCVNFEKSPADPSFSNVGLGGA
jgi:hypothetical protein